MIKANKIPAFKSMEDERRFWDTHEITDFPELKEVHNIKFPCPKHIVLDIRPRQFKTLNRLATQKGTTYRRLLQKWIAQKLFEEKIALPH